MSARDDGGPAFPITPPLDLHCGGSAAGYDYPSPGMSLRDWFAGQAIAGLVVGCAGMLGNEFAAYAKGDCNAVLANRAYTLADAMLAARKAQP